MVIISVPWNADTEKSIQRAKIEGGEIKYIEEPKYHWNPVSQKSDSLVFWDYGWDFIDFMRQTGFNNAYVQAYYDTSKGYLGDIGLYFIGEKKK